MGSGADPDPVGSETIVSDPEVFVPDPELFVPDPELFFQDPARMKSLYEVFFIISKLCLE